MSATLCVPSGWRPGERYIFNKIMVCWNGGVNDARMIVRCDSLLGKRDQMTLLQIEPILRIILFDILLAQQLRPERYLRSYGTV